VNWIRDYFRGLVVAQRDYWLPRALDGAARWFFDVLKNMLTAGVLLAIAQKTESPALGALANVATGLLAVFVLTPAQGWYLDILHPVKSEAVRIAGAVAVRTLIGGVIIWLAYSEIRPAIIAIAGWNQK
jgi:hypothetical protein